MYVGLISGTGSSERYCEAVAVSKDFCVVAEALWDEYCKKSGNISHLAFIEKISNVVNDRFDIVDLDCGDCAYVFKIQKVKVLYERKL